MVDYKKVPLCLLFLLLVFSANLNATEEYAQATGAACSVCHLDPSGGGELTAEGDGYALSLTAQSGSEETATEKSLSFGLFRLVVGYLHILFGFFWFGTILYVHLILKPTYASAGLPRGEVKLGLISMVMMGVTGAILFVYRVPDATLLFSTRFGLLLLIKIILYLIMACSALFVVFFLGPRLHRKRAETSLSDNESLSLEQLAEFDGKEGNKAYFAYQGDIYDATDSTLWKNGSHMGRHQAGYDLTDILKQAPHGEDKVKALPRIGKLRTDRLQAMTLPQKIFYTMAYMNLSFVFLIILILACWRWWP